MRADMQRRRRSASQDPFFVAMRDLVSGQPFAEWWMDQGISPRLMELDLDNDSGTRVSLVSLGKGVRYMILSMLGSKGSSLVVRASELVDGRRVPVADLRLHRKGTVVNPDEESEWNTDPQSVRALNTILALSDEFVIHPKMCAEFLAELNDSQSRAEALDRLVRDL